MSKQFFACKSPPPMKRQWRNPYAPPPDPSYELVGPALVHARRKQGAIADARPNPGLAQNFPRNPSPSFAAATPSNRGPSTVANVTPSFPHQQRMIVGFGAYPTPYGRPIASPTPTMPPQTPQRDVPRPMTTRDPWEWEDFNAASIEREERQVSLAVSVYFFTLFCLPRFRPPPGF